MLVRCMVTYKKALKEQFDRINTKHVIGSPNPDGCDRNSAKQCQAGLANVDMQQKFGQQRLGTRYLNRSYICFLVETRDGVCGSLRSREA
jgi:hypothetical protein